MHIKIIRLFSEWKICLFLCFPISAFHLFLCASLFTTTYHSLESADRTIVIHWSSATEDGATEVLKDRNGNPLSTGVSGNGDGYIVTLGYFIPDGDCSLYGQEINGATRALAKMNMFLHERDSADIRWGDTKSLEYTRLS